MASRASNAASRAVTEPEGGHAAAGERDLEQSLLQVTGTTADEHRPDETSGNASAINGPAYRTARAGR